MTQNRPSCTLPDDQTIDLSFAYVHALRDSYPVSLGHTLIILRRQSPPGSTPHQLSAWSCGVRSIPSANKLQQEFSAGVFNIGINSGEAARQTVPHLRYEADRANVPITLVDLPKFQELVAEHGESFSPNGIAFLPLKKVFWPAN